MEHRTASSFWQSYEALPSGIRPLADKQFSLLRTNPQHPSIQFKPVGSRRGQELWSARVTLSFRALAVKLPDGYLWFWIGDHKQYDALIR